MIQSTTNFVRCCYFKLPLLWANFRSQKYLFEETILYVIKYINLKFKEISLLFNILMLFMTTLRSGYTQSNKNPSA